MNYEKAYKDALSRAKDCHVNKKFSELDDNAQQLCEYIFPELVENEDEKIKKALIDYFDNSNKVDENPLQSYGIYTDKVIAWLEKQGEQKSHWKPTKSQLEFFLGMSYNSGLYLEERNFLEDLYNNLKEL